MSAASAAHRQGSPGFDNRDRAPVGHADRDTFLPDDPGRAHRPPAIAGQGHTAGERRGAATSSLQQDELHDQATCAELFTAVLLTLAQLLLEPLKQPRWISAITPIINQMTTTTTEWRIAGSSGALNAGRLRDGTRLGWVPPG